MRKTLSMAAACVLALANVVSASVTGDQVIASVKKTFAAINDYRVDAKLTVKGESINISNKLMTIYYKKPNKVRVEARDGAALVPTNSMIGNPIEELTRGTRATYVKSEKKSGVDCHVIKLTAPNQPPLSVWVDRKRSVIVATQGSGDFGLTTNWRYKVVDGKHYMPVEVSALMKMPGATSVKNGTKAKGTAAGSQQTRFTVSFSNYTINKGINDKVFEQKPRK